MNQGELELAEVEVETVEVEVEVETTEVETIEVETLEIEMVEPEVVVEVEVEAEVGMIVEIVVGVVGAGLVEVGVGVGVEVEELEVEFGVGVVEMVVGVDGLHYQLGKVADSVYPWLLADQRELQCDQLLELKWIERESLLYWEEGYFCYFADNSGGELNPLRRDSGPWEMMVVNEQICSLIPL